MLSAMLVTLALLMPAAVAQETVPPAWTPAVIDPCESAAGFASALDPDGNDPYEALELSTTDTARREGQSLQWSFRVKAGASAAALSHTGHTIKAGGAVSLWLKNPEDHDLRLSIRLIEADGSVYASQPVDLAGEKGWRQFVFMTDRVAPAPGSTDENGTLDLPPGRLELVVEGVGDGAEYTLYIDSVMAHFPPPERLRLTGISAPEATAPGQEIEVRVTVQAPEQLQRPHRLTLALVGGAVVVTESELTFAREPSAWPAGGLVESVPIRLRIPEFVAGGKYALTVQCSDAELSGPASDGVEIEVGGLMVGSVTAEVTQHNGAPSILINNVPTSGMGYLCRDADEPWLKALGQSADPLALVPATADHDPYAWAADVWLSQDDWDYGALDRSIVSILERQPKARLVLRTFLCAPRWWTAENPRECILFAHGRHAVELPGIAGQRTYPSFSSEKWRTEAGEALRRFVAHVEGAPYADRVVGYQLASGEDGRWRHWGAASGFYGDYSYPQTRAFIDWLREKYGNDIRKLRGAWQRIITPMPGMDPKQKVEPALEWEDIKAPAISARTNHPSQSLLDPAAAPEVIDYNLFHAHQIADCIAHFASIAKQACHSRKLVGVSYGHLFEHSLDAHAVVTAGHIGIGDVLGSLDIDFIAGPATPVTDPSPAGPGAWSSLAASVKSHGKVWLEEELPGDGRRQEPAGRSMARTLAGAGWLWSPGERFSQREAGALAASLGWDRSSVSEIALVVDHYSLAYTAEGNALSMPLLRLQQAELEEIGAPYDVWLLDDLIAGRMPDYKLYLFANAFFLDPQAREVVKNHVGRNGKTALWVFAPGALDRSMSGRTAFELTGLSVAFVPKTAPLRVKVVNASHPLVDGVTKNLEYGTTEEAGPVFFAVPNRGEMIGTIQVPSLMDKEPQEWAGLIAREFDGWTSVYSAAPNVPAALLRGMARRAGVHLYVDTEDVIYGNASVLAIHALSAGDKQIKLPRRADVRDIMSGEAIASGASEFAVAMRAGETRLFYTGDPERFRL